MMFFPLKKLRRYSKYLLLGLILLVGVAVYHEMIAVKAWSGESSMNPDSSSWRRAMFDERVKKDRVLDSMGDSDAWKSSYTPQPWKPEYKGLANLHVFEDWCGSSIADLCKNMHYPLYPHARTTVPKLAVSPQWTNYGLRIFGYLHPYIDGEFVFALSSDDNSEFWLSTDDSPFNVQLLAWVGKTGAEWTIPGEFDKYASQTSKPVWLSAQRKYFFEVVYKQNDRGTDHVEVAWQLVDQDFRFMVIESSHISLYVNESALLLSDVTHIPLTAASHQRTATKQQDAPADMLRGDLRDTLYQVPLINSKFLQGVLPDCTYKPSYTIKDLPLLRYQGLQFVRMSYVYPNDYTRLTHMESPESCFYPESPYYMKMFGFSRYMRLDRPNVEEEGHKGRDFGFQRSALHEEEDRFYNAAYQRGKEIRPNQREKFLFPDYGDDFDDYSQKRRRKLFSLHIQETKILAKSTSETRPRIDVVQRRQRKDGDRQLHKPVETLQQVPLQASKLNHIKLNPEGQVRRVGQIKPKVNLKTTKRRKFKSSEGTARPVKINPVIPVDKEQLKAKEPPEHLNFKQRSRKMIHNHVLTLKESKLQLKQQRFETRNNTRTTPKTEIPVVRQIQEDAHARRQFKDKEIQMNMPPQQDEENSIYKLKSNIGGKMDMKESDAEGVENQAWDDNNVDNRDLSRSDFRKGERESLWGQQEDTDDEDLSPTLVFDSQVNWNQTFQVSHLDLQTQRLDMIDLRCNISGNLLLHSTGSLHVVKAFMDQLNQKHHGQFTLVNVVNVVKRVDEAKGNRYLLELELKDANGQLLRLSHYVYTLISYSRQRRREFRFQRMKPPMLLCNPVGIHWNPDVTVHFIVPVKNQARWVQQLIADMEQLFRDTQDTNFNLIITDYNSTDMDVRMALEKSSLPRYKYVKLSGNFERSAGLQAGVDIIDDEHSIVFLCDLHIQFPPSIIDTIRKHCVEGYMAFAPIVMRLNCGATPLDARGYWEVNGFGLLGIYKSDLDAAGGMNTREFTDRWGGEDWELLDRILQAGLEVERIYLRNFFHHYHSKRGMWNRRISLRQR